MKWFIVLVVLLGGCAFAGTAPECEPVVVDFFAHEAADTVVVKPCL